MARRLLLGLGFVLSACGYHARPVEFQGLSAERVVPASAVSEASALPRGAERLGRLFVHCRPLDAADSFSDLSLLDVDCSEPRLRRLLYEAASELGGDVLAELSCQVGSTVSCRATLARREEQPRSRFAPSAIGEDVRGELGANVWVSFESRRAKPRGPARAEDNVTELAALAPAQLALGNLETRCDACSELSARDALRIAAGRLGASDLVAVRCVSQGAGQRCFGEAAAWEREP